MNTKFILLLLSLALLDNPVPTQVGDSVPQVGSLTTECSSVAGCSKCFMADKMICYECMTDYIRESRPGETGQCWKYTPREISGYGRDCVSCGEMNYPKDGKCFPCPFKCQTCVYDPIKKGPSCKTTKPPTGRTPGYEPDGSCTDGLSIDDDENVKYCYCNDANDFTLVGSDGTVGCYECSTCFRNFPNCKGKGVCPTKTFDPLTCTSCDKVDIDTLKTDAIELSVCCQDCDITCETCSGPDRDDCITCRSEGEQLFEMVDGQCMCVCHSKEVVEGDNVKCVCNEGREAKLDAAGVYQCMCKEGTVDAAAADKDGVVQCVPQSVSLPS